MSESDLRTTPVRPDLAARRLEGLVAAPRYVDALPTEVVVPAMGLRTAPEAGAEMADQLLFGERFDAYLQQSGWSWGQARRDGYVGWVETASLAAEGGPATHRISALRTYAFAEPSIKARAIGPYSLNALARVTAREGRFALLDGAGWVSETAIKPLGQFEDDPAAVALLYLGAPYLWGGRESLGLDCSGLVQQAFYACGRACPRDSDQQARQGAPVAREALRRNDLVFWKGHMGIMLDPETLLHANAHHMAVAIEPLDEAIRRIEAAGAGAPTGYRRP
jgi:cell wall-associated NlpC family hydrolase